MSKAFSLRQATRADLPALLALYVHLNPDDTDTDLARSETSFDQFLRYDGSAIFLGETDGTLVSSCALVVIPNLTRGGAPYGLIENVVTHQAYRGRGFGTAVLDAAAQRAWDQGCYKVMLMTGSKRPETLSFYQRAGFEQSKTGFQKRRVAARRDQ